jgi:hypothetical protein
VLSLSLALALALALALSFALSLSHSLSLNGSKPLSRLYSIFNQCKMLGAFGAVPEKGREDRIQGM